MKNRIQVGIIGGAGYTAGELIRLLLRHPDTQIGFVHSTSQAGRKVHEIHTDLVGESDLSFVSDLPFDKVDVLFLCQGHGKAKSFLEKHKIPEQLKIIDLSRDYRLNDFPHDFVYGLPELNRELLGNTLHVANPGCFATCLQLGLLPIAQEQALPEDIHIHAITGSTGAGQNPSATTHFSWRNNNLSIYKPFSHQHLGEIRRSLTQLQPTFSGNLNFLPLRGNFTRGIYASIYFTSDLSLDSAVDLFKTYYNSHPFVWVQKEIPHLKQVVNTNKCVLSVSKHGDKILIVSMIDNLLKGASGQAVQNLNILFGREESKGLLLKASAF